MDDRQSTNSNEDQNNSIHLQISDLQYRLSDTLSPNTTMFEPQNSMIETRDSSATNHGTNSVSDDRRRKADNLMKIRAPEKKLTLFALRLAVLEKCATGLGTLGFIWATVVLLGGFAITLDTTDFWFITVILVIEGTRIFSRSHELEWQHQATWSIADVGIRRSFRALRTSSSFLASRIKALFRHESSQERNVSGNNSMSYGDDDKTKWDYLRRRNKPSRRWTSSEVPLLPYGRWVFVTRHVSRILYWLQLLSATACVALSATKLVEKNFGEIQKGDTDKRNRKSALLIFYALALAEALLFLVEKAYWEYNVTFQKLLEQVGRECELGTSGPISIRRFFYDAYSKCVNGSVFDGLKMDMVSFAMELLESGSSDEQLIGARILRQLSSSERYCDDTVRKIGLNFGAIERLVEALNWSDVEEEETRRCAAEILSRLAGKKQNSLRVAGIPGSMDSISSLLQTGRTSACGAADEVGERKVILEHCNPSYELWEFNNLGLLILKKLARDHDICGKIGSTRGLLPKIVEFTHADERLLTHSNAAESQVRTVKRSLQVVKRLAGTTGPTGKQLRREISEIIFTISNIRDILKYGHKHPVLQQLGIEIFSSLALEDDASERIGGTGGALKGLVDIFFRQDLPKSHDQVRRAAGEALAMLVVESKNNCQRVLKLGVLGRLVWALDEPLLRINAARILRNLCSYVGNDCFNQLKGVTIAAPTVLKAIMSTENKLQEVMVGLAAHVFRFMDSQESSLVFFRAGVTEPELAYALVQILKKYRQPHIKIPRIRRFSIELSIWMMRDKASNIQIFREFGLEKELEGVLETTAELESFNMFSGTVGMSRHSTTIHSLVETALSLLVDG